MPSIIDIAAISRALRGWYPASHVPAMIDAYVTAGPLHDSDVRALAQLSGTERGRGLAKRYPGDDAYKTALEDLEIRARQLGVQLED